MSETDDLEAYRSYLERLETAEDTAKEIEDCFKRLRIAEYRGPLGCEPVYDGYFDGLSRLHARLRLAERHAKALAARCSDVPGSGGLKGETPKRRAAKGGF